MRAIILIIFIFNYLFADNSNGVDNRGISLKVSTFMWKTNWKKHSIDYDELVSGGPPRDGIPPIDKPNFETIKEAKTWIKDDEPLIFVNINNQSKAYPLQVLIWHEIVNDTIADKKIAVTFCPLCNASIVFNRVINNKEYDFGTSGLLRNSDLVMYDRQSESLWQQFTGEAIVGDMLGVKLEQINSSIVSFKDIYTNFAETKILSKKTGFRREYGNNPYIGYDNINDSPFMLKQEVDSRLKPMIRVATISINDKHKAYSYTKLRKIKLLNDSFENKKLVLFYKNNVTSVLDKQKISESKLSGTILIYNRQVKDEILEFYYEDGNFYDKKTKSKWNIFGKAIEGKLKGEQLQVVNHGNHFWFAWVVFKPQTILFK